jgi:hypothetical protein
MSFGRDEIGSKTEEKVMNPQIRCTVRVENVKKSNRGTTVVEIVPLKATATLEDGSVITPTSLGSISLEFDNPEAAGKLLEIGRGWHLDFTEAPEASKAVGKG